jgi:hypothetical protein
MEISNDLVVFYYVMQKKVCGEKIAETNPNFLIFTVICERWGLTSGPPNSLRGAAIPSGMRDVDLVDVGRNHHRC